MNEPNIKAIKFFNFQSKNPENGELSPPPTKEYLRAIVLPKTSASLKKQLPFCNKL
jgi:hypothetical protein